MFCSPLSLPLINLLIKYHDLMTRRLKAYENGNKNQWILHGFVFSFNVFWLSSRAAALPCRDPQGALRVDWACDSLRRSSVFLSLTGQNGPLEFWKTLYRRPEIVVRNVASCLLIIVRWPSAGSGDKVASLPVSVWLRLHLLSYFGSSTLDVRLWICVSEQKSHSPLWDYAHTLNLFFCRDSSLIFAATQSVNRQHSPLFCVLCISSPSGVHDVSPVTQSHLFETCEKPLSFWCRLIEFCTLLI